MMKQLSLFFLMISLLLVNCEKKSKAVKIDDTDRRCGSQSYCDTTHMLHKLKVKDIYKLIQSIKYCVADSIKPGIYPSIGGIFGKENCPSMVDDKTCVGWSCIQGRDSSYYGMSLLNEHIANRGIGLGSPFYNRKIALLNHLNKGVSDGKIILDFENKVNFFIQFIPVDEILKNEYILNIYILDDKLFPIYELQCEKAEIKSISGFKIFIPRGKINIKKYIYDFKKITWYDVKLNKNLSYGDYQDLTYQNLLSINKELTSKRYTQTKINYPAIIADDFEEGYYYVPWYR